jgi:hypothetical protein
MLGDPNRYERLGQTPPKSFGVPANLALRPSKGCGLRTVDCRLMVYCRLWSADCRFSSDVSLPTRPEALEGLWTADCGLFLFNPSLNEINSWRRSLLAVSSVFSEAKLILPRSEKKLSKQGNLEERYNQFRAS